MRWIFAMTMLLAALVSPAMAQEEDTPWQAVVTSQIEALRAQDGVTALSFASAGFRTQFEQQPETFFAAIVASGYQPIVESRSHSFGKFTRVSETVALQVVNFVGANQSLYEAVYQLADEPDVGWRVQGVVLRRTSVIGI